MDRSAITSRETGSETENSNVDSKDFMQAEYEQLIEADWHSEDIGEKRLELFLTLVTAVLGILTLRQGTELADLANQDLPVAVVAVFAIALLGWLTLLRLAHRNTESTRYLRKAALVRRYFVDEDPSIARYLWYGRDDQGPCRKPPRIVPSNHAGLVETAALITALASGGLIALVIQAIVFRPPVNLAVLLVSWLIAALIASGEK